MHVPGKPVLVEDPPALALDGGRGGERNGADQRPSNVIDPGTAEDQLRGIVPERGRPLQGFRLHPRHLGASPLYLRGQGLRVRIPPRAEESDLHHPRTLVAPVRETGFRRGPMSETGQWYVATNGKQQGPMAVAGVLELIRARQVDRTSYVFAAGGAGAWVPITSIAAFATAFEPSA